MSKKPDRTEEPPDLDKDDNDALDKAWDEIDKEEKEKERRKKDKKKG